MSTFNTCWKYLICSAPVNHLKLDTCLWCIMKTKWSKNSRWWPCMGVDLHYLQQPQPLARDEDCIETSSFWAVSRVMDSSLNRGAGNTHDVFLSLTYSSLSLPLTFLFSPFFQIIKHIHYLNSAAYEDKSFHRHFHALHTHTKPPALDISIRVQFSE